MFEMGPLNYQSIWLETYKYFTTTTTTDKHMIGTKCVLNIIYVLCYNSVTFLVTLKGGCILYINII